MLDTTTGIFHHRQWSVANGVLRNNVGSAEQHADFLSKPLRLLFFRTSTSVACGQRRVEINNVRSAE